MLFTIKTYLHLNLCAYAKLIFLNGAVFVNETVFTLNWIV